MTHDNCSLYDATHTLVEGEGPTPSRIMIIGEAPGRNEVRLGRPFVGASGRLLNHLLTKVGIERGDCYVTNVVKHLPPRKPPTPSAKETRECLPHLLDEIERVQPQIIITIGSIPLSVFVPKAKITKEHGVARVVDGRIVIPWIHPAASMRPGGAAYLAPMRQDVERFWAEVERVSSQAVAKRDYRLGLDGLRILGDGVRIVGFDTETTSPMRGGVFQTDEACIIGFSVATQPHRAAYVSTRTGLVGEVARDDRGWTGVGRLGKLVGDGSYTKVIHNSKFEWKVLRNTYGFELANYHDTLVAAYLLGIQPVGLKALSRQLLGVEPIAFAAVTAGRDMSEVPPQDVMEYACMDADHTLRLWYLLQPRLVAEGLWDVYENIEMPLVPVLAKMEGHGVRLDRDAALLLQRKIERESEVAAALVISRFGDSNSFNPYSHEQLGAALEAHGFPIAKRTKVKRIAATDNESLMAMRPADPDAIDAILKMRFMGKLETYIESWLELADSRGYIHTSFNQAGHYEEAGGDAKGTPPGRLSSSDPNLQNIPHHSDEEMGRRIRSLIIPSEGNVLVAADVEQEEPRIIAYVTGDSTLRNAFANGQDIYRPATEAIYPHVVCGLSDAEWKRAYSHERYNGKTFVLAWWYGAESARLKTIDPSLSDAAIKKAMRRLSKAHPSRFVYLGSVEADLRRDGCVKSLFGRKRWIPQAATGRIGDMKEAVRIGANAIIQMTAADVLKQAMVYVDNQLTARRMDAKMVLTIHDELIFDCPTHEVWMLRPIVAKAFDGLVPFALPLDIRVGANWGEL